VQEVILQLTKDALQAGIMRILCLMRELAVISHDLVRDDIELIAYGNYPLWISIPAYHNILATASPEDALKMGADLHQYLGACNHLTNNN